MTFAEVINRWPSLGTFARDAGVAYGTAKQWRRRGRIPPEYWSRIVEGAEKRGIEGVTLEGLADDARGMARAGSAVAPARRRGPSGKHDDYPDRLIRDILRRTRTIAMVGASGEWRRPSNFAMKYLQKKGYRVVPVNPSRAGEEILGEKVYARVADIPDRLDMVDIFRSSEEAGPLTDEVIAVAKEKGIKVLWMQLGIRNDAAAGRAEAAGLAVVMNRCPKIEYARLSGELSWSGINSRIISAKALRAPR